MRKAILLILTVVQSCLIYAQSRSKFEQEISVGGSVGLNLSQVRFLHNNLSLSNQLGELGWKKGITAGATCRYIAQKHFGLQLEINYAQSGWSEVYENNDNSPIIVNGTDLLGKKIEQSVDYLSVPLLAHVYFGEKVRLFVNFGPKIGYVISTGKKCNDPDIKNAVIEGDPRIYNISESKIDYGMCAGCGIEFNAGKIHTLAEFRWTYGLQDVYPHERDDIFQRSNNQSIALSLSFLIPVAKFHSN